MKHDEMSEKLFHKNTCNFWITIILYCSESADQPVTNTGEAMSNSSPERNKAIVLEAFETLFNKRDYAAAERFWSPNYIQHSAHIAPGREGLFNLVRSVPETLHYENQLIAAEAITSSRMAVSGGWAGPPPGSLLTLSGSKAVFLESIGTFCRTRRPRPNLSAAFPCLATHSPSDCRKQRDRFNNFRLAA